MAKYKHVFIPHCSRRTAILPADTRSRYVKTPVSRLQHRKSQNVEATFTQ